MLNALLNRRADSEAGRPNGKRMSASPRWPRSSLDMSHSAPVGATRVGQGVQSAMSSSRWRSARMRSRVGRSAMGSHNSHPLNSACHAAASRPLDFGVVSGSGSGGLGGVGGSAVGFNNSASVTKAAIDAPMVDATGMLGSTRPNNMPPTRVTMTSGQRMRHRHAATVAMRFSVGSIGLTGQSSPLNGANWRDPVPLYRKSLIEQTSSTQMPPSSNGPATTCREIGGGGAHM